jgi:hypothetical protein
VNISGNLLFIIVVLAGISVLQFQKGRRLNLMLMKAFVEGFEKKLKLRDKNYTWIGGSAGFKADYDLSDNYVKKVELTLTLIPRQSLFYLPISFLVKRGDRLFIVLRPRFTIKNDAHIIRNFYYLFGPEIKEIHELKKGIIELENTKGFYTLFEEEETLEKLRKLTQEVFSDIKRVRHIALVKSTNVLFCLIKPDPYKTPDEIRKLVEKFPKIFCGKGELREFQ